jgi:hypothetical protein
MAARGLVIHGAILALAGALALRTWTKDESVAPKAGETELWPLRVKDVQEVRFESKAGVIRVEPREDTAGKYFIGTVKKNPEPKKEPPPAGSAAITPEKPPEPEEPKSSQFIATKEAEELVNQLAPLKALRVLGKLTDAQKEEFGFHQDEGKLFVRAGGAERSLIFGGSTPGGTDRYAKDATSGNAYVVAGSILRDLTSADQRLIQHDLHGWEAAAAKRVKITVGDAKRELVRSEASKDAWAKPEEPGGKDETASNWLSKVERLRVTSYLSDKLEPAPAIADTVVRVDYYDERKPIGYVEIIRRPGETPDKQEYVARTEHTRWYATVVRSAAEQIDQDLKSVIAP